MARKYIHILIYKKKCVMLKFPIQILEYRVLLNFDFTFICLLCWKSWFIIICFTLNIHMIVSNTATVSKIIDTIVFLMILLCQRTK